MAKKLQERWTPEQIAGWLKHSHPGNEEHQVSHKTIYRSLHVRARAALKKELWAHLRRTRTMRRSRPHTQKTVHHGQLRDTVSTSGRPASVEDRAVPGHWEVARLIYQPIVGLAQGILVRWTSSLLGPKDYDDWYRRVVIRLWRAFHQMSAPSTL